jgi:hypothetical protein
MNPLDSLLYAILNHPHERLNRNAHQYLQSFEQILLPDDNGLGYI